MGYSLLLGELPFGAGLRINEQRIKRKKLKKSQHFPFISLNSFVSFYSFIHLFREAVRSADNRSHAYFYIPAYATEYVFGCVRVSGAGRKAVESVEYVQQPKAIIPGDGALNQFLKKLRALYEG